MADTITSLRMKAQIRRIKELIEANPQITQKEIAKELRVSSRTVTSLLSKEKDVMDKEFEIFGIKFNDVQKALKFLGIGSLALQPDIIMDLANNFQEKITQNPLLTVIVSVGVYTIRKLVAYYNTLSADEVEKLSKVAPMLLILIKPALVVGLVALLLLFVGNKLSFIKDAKFFKLMNEFFENSASFLFELPTLITGFSNQVQERITETVEQVQEIALNVAAEVGLTKTDCGGKTFPSFADWCKDLPNPKKLQYGVFFVSPVLATVTNSNAYLDYQRDKKMWINSNCSPPSKEELKRRENFSIQEQKKASKEAGLPEGML
jgi:hypothetical protein